MPAKKSAIKKTSTPNVHAIIESNLQLQHKIADLVLTTKELNTNVSHLITIFKEAGQYIKSAKYEDPMINKINDLLEQNKNLAKGLAILEEYVKNKAQPQSSHY